MLQDVEMLNYVYQNAEMGRDALTQLIQITNDTKFRKTMEAQLNEYQNVFDSAEKMIQERNEQAKGVGPMAKISSRLMVNAKTMMDSSPSKMAQMLIQGSTMGVVEVTRHMKDYDGSDERVNDISQKLLRTEQQNIEEMKKYL